MMKRLKRSNSMRLDLAIAAVVGVATLLCWWLLNRPISAPPWPPQVGGFAFSPMHADQDPNRGEFPSVEQIAADLDKIAGQAHGIRTYTVESTMAELPQLAAAHGLELTLGAWLDKREDHNAAELLRLAEVYHAHQQHVGRVIVGNETVLRGDLTVEQIITHIQNIKRALNAPVGTAEPWHVWLDHPELADAVDFIGIHLLPYWEGVSIDRAVDYVFERYAEVQAAFPDKTIIVTETGWPSDGRTRFDAVASVANQGQFLRHFVAAAEREGLDYYLMEAFDQPWKQVFEGPAGAYWGVFNADRQPKFSFVEAISPMPNWGGRAALSIGLAFGLAALLLQRGHNLRRRGVVFLCMIVYGVVSLGVWLFADYLRQYLDPGLQVMTVVLAIGMFGAVVLLLTEAHEWTEALWLRRWQRQPELPRPQQTDAPRVSIHVPAYNEPPEMLIASLDALARLDYPNYEVVVVDNNTRDPARWQPIKAHCQRLGERFRFHHVASLKGYKAGALNFALAHSDPAAKIIAVIDSDYQVEPDWLRDLVPLFRDPAISLVQSPQDYRDGHESLFKAMCQAEYRGFFDVGMMTRNERDAIIQHGTMTLVRRATLVSVGGWSEWCITEDAELGLKILEAGQSSLYVPRSYGRGLVPDSFLDFKLQRFRWAYGAARILGKHLGQLTGTRTSGLTTGQRYHFVTGWLPWLADALNLLINLVAIGWTAGMVLMPERFAPPHPAFVVLPMALFGFKLTKLLSVYRWRVRASFRESVAAGVAGLALSHVVARAVLTSVVDHGVGFFRTPKRSSARGLLRVWGDAREEFFLLGALLLGAIAVLWREDGELVDVRLWSTLLVLQAMPYAASVLLSIISATPRLSGRLVSARKRAVATSSALTTGE